MDHSSRILPIGIRIRPAAWLLALGLCFISSFAAGAPATWAQDSRQPSWSTDGNVNAILETNRGVVLGGTFKLLLPPANHVAFIDPASGVARGPFLNVKGSSVLAAAEDGQGGWFFGGQFDSLQGQPRRNLAHVDANGLVTDWNPGTDKYGAVCKLLRIGDRLLVGGQFSQIAGGARQGLAAVHAATGALLPWNPQLETGSNGGVWDLLVSDTTVFVAGLFFGAGGQFRQSLAQLGLETGMATPWAPTVGGTVYTLALSDTVLFVGGECLDFRNLAQFNLLAYSTNTASSALSLPSTDGPVWALALRDTTLYVGGSFFRVAGDSPAGNNMCLFAVGSRTGALHTWNPRLNSAVTCLKSEPTGLLVGGSFTQVDTAWRSGIAELDPVSGRATGLRVYMDGFLWSLQRSAGSLLATGMLTYAGAMRRSNLAMMDRVSGVPLPWRADVDSSVSALAVSGSTLYVGGGFQTLAGAPRRNLGSVSLSNGAATPWQPDPDQPVNALCTLGGNVVAGGDFSVIAGSAASHLALVDGTTGQALPWADPPDGPVLALARSAGRLYVGGLFSAMGPTRRRNAAAVDSASGRLLRWDPSANREVLALHAAGGLVYAGGPFDSIGGYRRARVAELDSSSGSAAAFTPTPPLFGWVYALVSRGGMLYAGDNSDGVTQMDLASGAATRTVDGFGYALALGDQKLRVGGQLALSSGFTRGYASFLLARDELRISPARIAVGESTSVTLSGNSLDECVACRLRSDGRQIELPLGARGGGLARVPPLLFRRTDVGEWQLECTHNDGTLETGGSTLVFIPPLPRVRVHVTGRQRVRIGAWSAYSITLQGDSLRTARGRVEIPLLNTAGWLPIGGVSLTGYDAHGGLVLTTPPMTLRPNERASVDFKIQVPASASNGDRFGIKGRWVPALEKLGR